MAFGAPFRLYRLRDGDSLSVLAEDYNVDVRAIALSNGLADPDRVRSGRGILLPSTPSTMNLPQYVPLRTGAPELTPCATAVAPAPEPTERADCIEAACTTLEQTTFCQCHVPGGDGRRMMIAGQITASWSSPGGRSIDAFTVAKADLNADGRDEWVVAVHAYTSMGISVVTTHVAVLEAGARTPLTFSSAGFAFDRSLGAREGRCGVVTGSVEEATEPRPGSGTYEVSRRFIYEAGTLRPDLATPIWGTRFGASRVVQWDDEPIPRGEDGRWGKVEHVAVRPGNDDARMLQLDAVAEGVPLRMYSEDRRDAADGETDGDAPPFVSLWQGGRRMPAGYVPADPSAWHGREVWIGTAQEYVGSELELSMAPER